MHWSPPIFREVVLSDALESINRVKKGVFLVRKGSNMTFNTSIAKIGKIWEKQGKILKMWSMTKKSHQKFFLRNWKFLPPKTSFRNLGSGEKISVIFISN